MADELTEINEVLLDVIEPLDQPGKPTIRIALADCPPLLEHVLISVPVEKKEPSCGSRGPTSSLPSRPAGARRSTRWTSPLVRPKQQRPNWRRECSVHLVRLRRRPTLTAISP